MNLIVTTRPKGTLKRHVCPECDKLLVTASVDNYCPYCGSKTGNVKATSIEMSASSVRNQGLKTVLSCNDCHALIATDSNSKPEVQANHLHCPKCGSVDVLVATEDEVASMEVEDQEVEQRLNEIAEANEEQASEAEKEVEEQLTNVVVPDDQIEAHLVASNGNPTWWIYVNSVPTATIQASELPTEELKSIGTSEHLIACFKQEAQISSLAEAVRNFNGRFVGKTAAIAASALEGNAVKKAEQKLREAFAEALPVILAGASKNIWPEIYAPLKAEMLDQLQARAISNPVEIVEACFATGGGSTFAEMISMALDFANKPSSSQEEIRNLVFKSAKIDITADVKKVEADEVTSVRERLANGNMPMSASTGLYASTISQRKVGELRRKFNLSGLGSGA